MNDHHFHVYPDAITMSEAVADYFIKISQEAIADHGRFSVCLSGGSTPKRLFELLNKSPRKEQVDWTNVFVFWGDERIVPETSDDSNSGVARRLLFDHVSVPPAQIMPIDGTLEPAAAAEKYEGQLFEFFGDEAPAFDLCFLGMGDDGHTASLFPFTDVIYEETKWVSEVWVEKLKTWRISLTPEILNQANHIAFLIGGKNKATVLSNVLDGDFNPEKLPSQLIIRSGETIEFFLDEAAAAGLDFEN